MPDEPLVALSRVKPGGVVQIPLEIREKLGLKPGTKLIVLAAEDAVILQETKVLVAKKGSKSIIQRIQSIFFKVPIRNIED